jgi:hypothetical protein
MAQNIINNGFILLFILIVVVICYSYYIKYNELLKIINELTIPPI